MASKRPYITILGLIFLALLFVIYIRYVVAVLPFPSAAAPDFAINYTAATLLREGGSIYDSAALRHTHDLHIDSTPVYACLYKGLFLTYINPPSTAIILLPFSFLPFITAKQLYLLISNILYLSSILILLKSMKTPLLSLPGLIVSAVTLISLPLSVSLALGQMDALIIGLLTLALAATVKRHDTWAGALIVIAATVKISPILILGFFIAQKRWRALIGAAIAGIVAIGTMIFFVRIDSLAYFMLIVLPKVGQGSAYFQNQSLLGAIYRLNVPASAVISLDVDALGNYPTDRTVWAGLALLILGITLWLIKRAKLDHRPLVALAFGAVVLVGVLIGSIAWDHYLTWLSIPLAALIIDWFQTRWLGKYRFWLVLVSILFALNFPTISQLTLYQSLGPLASSVGTYGMMTMLGVIWQRLWLGQLPNRVN